MTAQELFQQIQQKRSFLCVGLDSDINKIPPHLLTAEDPIFEFNKHMKIVRDYYLSDIY